MRAHTKIRTAWFTAYHCGCELITKPDDTEQWPHPSHCPGHNPLRDKDPHTARVAATNSITLGHGINIGFRPGEDLFSEEPPDPMAEIKDYIRQALTEGDLDERVANLNQIREWVSDLSPFKAEPVDHVRWVKADNVHANDYNPNTVAPPEMELLRLSIASDGYTQPIVAMLDDDGSVEVIDGFHRHRVGKEYAEVRERVNGYLPVVQIRDDRMDKNDRIASTIRHNRARGKHMIQAMSDIVVELKRRNWTEQRIGKELGMDPDEVLRLCQITGLAELFHDEEFSQAWDVVDDVHDYDSLEETYLALRKEEEGTE